MGYDLEPRNKSLEFFHFNTFAWPVLVESFGMMYPWYKYGIGYVSPDGTYPLILSNEGFKVSANEARMMARMATNFVNLQRALPENWNIENGKIYKKIRSDFVDLFEKFASWAERSNGFKIN